MSVSNNDFLDNVPDLPGTPSFQNMMEYGDELAARAEREEEEEKKGKKIPLPNVGENPEEAVRAINYLSTPTWFWKWAVEKSNSLGVKLEKFLVTMLLDGYTHWEEIDDKKSPESYSLWAKVRSDAIKDGYENTYSLAVNCKNYPTEENTQRLHTACEMWGLDPGELMDRVRRDVYADLVARFRSDPDSKMSRCVKWVVEFCRDRDEIPSQIFNKAGKDAGFTRQMLYSARERVNIVSILRGGEYFLEMPKGQKVLYGRVSE